MSCMYSVPASQVWQNINTDTETLKALDHSKSCYLWKISTTSLWDHLNIPLKPVRGGKQLQSKHARNTSCLQRRDKQPLVHYGQHQHKKQLAGQAVNIQLKQILE